jgi:hypothetical protein
MEELQVQFFTILVGFLFIILSYLLHRCLQLDRAMVERHEKERTVTLPQFWASRPAT